MYLPVSQQSPITLKRSVSVDSYFLKPKVDKTDRRTYVYEQRGLPQACLFVASLNSSKSLIDLQKSVYAKFAQFGPLLNVTVNRDQKQRPFAFVQFKYIRDAERVYEQDDSIVIDDRQVRIERAKVNRTLLISRIQPGLDYSKVMEMASTIGQVEELDYYPEKQQAYIKFLYREDALKACAWYKQFGWISSWMNQPVLYSLYISNIHPNSKDELVQELKRYGQLEQVSFVEAEKIKCFVKYRSKKSAFMALRLNNTDFRGSVLSVVLKD